MSRLRIATPLREARLWLAIAVVVDPRQLERLRLPGVLRGGRDLDD